MDEPEEAAAAVVVAAAAAVVVVAAALVVVAAAFAVVAAAWVAEAPDEDAADPKPRAALKTSAASATAPLAMAAVSPDWQAVMVAAGALHLSFNCYFS